MKAILMVAYHYPPEGSSSGVLRTLKFSKYLPRHGWTPHILTLRESFYRERDEGLVGDVPPEATIHRTRGWDSARLRVPGSGHLGFFAVPDRVVSWLPFGVARGLRVIRQARVRALYSTSPRPTAHLIAGALRSLTGIPWIADFRDPWIEEGLYPPPGTLRYRVESRLERAVVRRADRITVTTPYLRGDFRSRYPALSPDRVRVIYNGYDEADFSQLPPPPRGACFEILHAGLVSREYRDPAPLLEAVAALVAAGLIARDRVRVVLLGGGKYPGSTQFAEVVGRLGLGDVVQVVPRVPNHEALLRLRRASCLLVMQASDDTRALIPAKAFEYLRVGRPILALTPEGATADLLKDMPHCLVADPADAGRLREGLAALYDEWNASTEAICVDRPVRRFERAALTGELASILDELTAGGVRD